MAESPAYQRQEGRWEAFHRAIDEAAPYGVFIADGDGNATYFSPSFQCLVGAPLERLVGFQWFERLAPADREPTRRRWQETVSAGRNWYHEFRVIDHEETPRLIISQAAPVKDSAGHVLEWVGVNLDGSQRDRLREENQQLRAYIRAIETIEDSLRESEAMYRELVESAATVILRLDSQLKVTYLNEFAQEVLGCVPEELLGRPVVGTLIPASDTNGHPLHKMIQEAYRNPRESQISESSHVRPDGRRVWLAWHSRPLIALDGGIREMVCVGADITQRKEAEEALRESEAKFRALAENAQVIIGIVQGRHFTYVNPYLQRLSGYTLQELLEMDIGQLIHPDDREMVVDRAQRRQRGEPMPPNYEFSMLTKSGEQRWLDFSPAGIQLEGRPAVIGVAYDVTERRRAEQELQRAARDLARSNEDLEQFAYAVSHDLQEPLRMVSGYVDLLRRRYQDILDDDGREFIAFALDGSARMSQLIKDLLRYSRVGRQRQECRPVELRAALERATADLWRNITETGAVLTHDDLPQVWADETMLPQVLMNLIGNAIKFRGEQPPRIHLGARREPGQWLLWVSDNGIGLDEQQRQRAFVAFQRLHDPQKYPGSGLGLAMCKKIVEQCGGKIWVESPGPSGGSTFYFTLPDHEQQVQRQAG